MEKSAGKKQRSPLGSFSTDYRSWKVGPRNRTVTIHSELSFCSHCIIEGSPDLRAFAAHASSACGFLCDFLPASSRMHARNVLALALSMPLTQAAETILGLYIFSRHGDRTAKATPPTVLTDLGYREVFDSGTWFRENYIVGGSPKQIAGIETDLVKYSQLAVSAPLDTVLMPSARGWPSKRKSTTLMMALIC